MGRLGGFGGWCGLRLQLGRNNQVSDHSGTQPRRVLAARRDFRALCRVATGQDTCVVTTGVTKGPVD